MKPRCLAAAAVLAASLAAGPASAQYRLRADAFFGAADPTMGLVMLTGEAHQPSWLTAETVVWAGGGTDHPGDVMVASVRARDADGLRGGAARACMIAAGCPPAHPPRRPRPHRQGPLGTSVEVFGGMPVVSSFQPRDYDWAAGARVAQRILGYGTIGLPYLQMREDGAVTYEEMGIDSTLHATSFLDAAFTSAIDLQSLAIADARLTISARIKQQPPRAVRPAAVAVPPSPGDLAFFSALGDLRPSQRLGGSLLLRPAPRLDVLGEGMVESIGGDLGGQGTVRANAAARRQRQGRALDRGEADERAGSRIGVRAGTPASPSPATGPPPPSGSWWPRTTRAGADRSGHGASSPSATGPSPAGRSPAPWRARASSPARLRVSSPSAGSSARPGEWNTTSGRRHFTLLLLAAMISTAACAEILGLRPPGHTPSSTAPTCSRASPAPAATGASPPPATRAHSPPPAPPKYPNLPRQTPRRPRLREHHGLPSTRAGAIHAKQIPSASSTTRTFRAPVETACGATPTSRAGPTSSVPAWPPAPGATSTSPASRGQLRSVPREHPRRGRQARGPPDPRRQLPPRARAARLGEPPGVRELPRRALLREVPRRQRPRPPGEARVRRPAAGRCPPRRASRPAARRRPRAIPGSAPPATLPPSARPATTRRRSAPRAAAGPPPPGLARPPRVAQRPRPRSPRSTPSSAPPATAAPERPSASAATGWAAAAATPTRPAGAAGAQSRAAPASCATAAPDPISWERGPADPRDAPPRRRPRLRRAAPRAAAPAGAHRASPSPGVRPKSPPGTERASSRSARARAGAGPPPATAEERAFGPGARSLTGRATLAFRTTGPAEAVDLRSSSRPAAVPASREGARPPS